MKRIVLVLDEFGFFGGPERRAYRIIKGLKDTGYNPIIISIAKSDENVVAKAKNDGVETVELTKEGGSALKSYRIDVFLKLRRAVLRINPDAVFTFEFLADYTTKMALLGIKTPIYTFNGNTIWKWEKKRHRRIAMEYFVRKSKLYIVNSNTVRDNVIRVLPQTEKKIKVIHNPIDTNEFKPIDEKTKLKTRKRFGLPKDDFIVGSVVRFYNPKGADTLVDAFYRADIKAKLVLVGDGSMRQKLEDMVKNFGMENKVVFLGALEANKDIYGMFDVCVVPSQKGGFDNVVIESMACGIPTVATRATGIGEIANNEEHLLISDIVSKSICENIKKIFYNYDSMKIQLSVSGRKLIKNKLESRVIVKKIERLAWA